jgi:NAD-dependent deacetylase
MFGEMIPRENQRAVESAMAGCDLFVAIGTSGTVYPANQIVSLARRQGARTVYINLQPLLEDNPQSEFEEEFLGKAEEIVPRLFGEGLPSELVKRSLGSLEPWDSKGGSP